MGRAFAVGLALMASCASESAPPAPADVAPAPAQNEVAAPSVDLASVELRVLGMT